MESFMDLTEEETKFLNMYFKLPPDLRTVVDKFMSGTPEEQAEAEKIIYRIIETKSFDI